MKGRLREPGKKITKLITGLGSVRIVKHVTPIGLENAYKTSVTVFTIRTSQPANNIYILDDSKVGIRLRVSHTKMYKKTLQTVNLSN